MIIDEKLQYDMKRVTEKVSALLSSEIDKCEYLTGEEILASDQSRRKGQAKFGFSLLGKAFKSIQRNKGYKEKSRNSYIFSKISLNKIANDEKKKKK